MSYAAVIHANLSMARQYTQLHREHEAALVVLDTTEIKVLSDL